MRTGWRRAIALAALLLARPFASRPAVAADPAQALLAQQLVAAMQEKDADMLERLLHPSVRACIDASNREYFDWLTHKAVNAPSNNYKTTIEPLKENAVPPFLPPDMFKYPIRPTHQLQIHWSDGNDTTVVIRTIAALDGVWYVVFPCPDAAGAKFVHEAHDRAVTLAAAVTEPLRSQLKGLLTRGLKLDAIEQYQRATGADLTSATQVLDVLKASN
jgi:hypothetical protein